MSPGGRRTGERIVYGAAAVLAALAAYALVSNLYALMDTRVLPRSLRLLLRPGILPPLQAILAALQEAVTSGRWVADVGASLLRVLEGLTAGALLGVGTGLAMGWSRRVDDYLDPLYNLLRPVPPLAFVTLFILWFGIGEASKVLLIGYGVFMTTVIPTYQGVRDVPGVYLQAARALGAGPRQLLLRVVLPAAAPRILTGLRLAVMAAWGIIVAAELIASTEGVGHMIIMAQAQYDTARVMAGIASLAGAGYAMDTAVRLVSARLTHWMRRAEA